MTDTNILEKSNKIKLLLEQITKESFDDYDLGDVIDEDMTVVTCPVCGKKTLDRWHICTNCGWEYSYIDDEDEFDDCNGSTIAEYREAFECLKKQTAESV